MRKILPEGIDAATARADADARARTTAGTELAANPVLATFSVTAPEALLPVD